MPDRMFPIMSGGDLKLVPWAVVEPARQQLMRNHGQTVERLAQRGGLDPIELVGALKGLRWSQLRSVNLERAIAYLRRLAAEASDSKENGDG